MSLSNRVVVITGASGGVGQEVTLRWLAGGAAVVAVDASEPAQAALAAAYAATKPSEPGRLVMVSLDISTAAGATEAFAAASRAFDRPADTLIHLVGGFAYGDFDSDDGAETWEKMLKLNVMTAVHMFRAAIAEYRKRGGGWIVGVGSRAAYESSPKMAAYAASKAALVSLVRSVSAEVRDADIHVNAILPSTIDTPANRASMGDADAGKWVTPAEIAEATMFLCRDSDNAAHGTTLELYAKA